MKKILIVFLLFALNAGAQEPLRYKKVPGVPIVHSPKSTGVYVGSPSIVILSNGDYVASHDFFGNPDGNRQSELAGDTLITRVMGQHIYLSKDKGKTWQFQTEVGYIHWAGLFVVRDTLYLSGIEGINYSLVITRSADRGRTWEKLSVLKKKEGHFFHGSTTPVVFHRGRIYKGYDNHVPDKTGKWVPDNNSFIMSAAVDDDLLNPASWTFSNEAKKPGYLPGSGWLETNAVLGRDGYIKGVLRIAATNGFVAGYYSLGTDSTIDASTIGQIDFIGGASKFNIRWDPVTKKYWALTNYPSPVIHPPNKSAGGMRSILTLISSKNLRKWEIQSIVLATEDVNLHGFQYVDWQFEGEDIVFVSRTGYDDEYGGAKSYHDTNFITFHRIKNYRKSKTPKKFRYLLQH